MVGKSAFIFRDTHRLFEIEDDRQVHEDDVVLGDREIVNHGRAGHVDLFGLYQHALGVDPVVGEQEREESIAEEMHFAGFGAELGVSCHAGLQFAGKIVGADRLEFGRHLGRETGLDQSKHAPGVLHDICVGHRDGAVDGKVFSDKRGLRVREGPGAYPSVAEGAGPAALELDAMQHAVAREPMLRGSALWVGAVAHIAAAEARRNLPLDWQVK